MTDETIIAMLEDILSEVDYDLYKGLFVKECIEDPVEAKETRKRLVEIVNKYL